MKSPTCLSWTILLIASGIFWTFVGVVIVRERSQWHGQKYLNHEIQGSEFSGDRQLYERETEDGHVVDVMISETVSLNPRVKVIHDFLTAKECELLIAEGKEKLSPSYVVGVNGKNEASSARSSSGTFLTKRTEIVKRLESRIARVTMLPQENQEAFYLLRYTQGQEYRTHPDYFAKETPEAAEIVENAGGQRVATVLLYLNEVEEGGHTRFAKGGIEVEAKRGQALFWWDCHPNGTVDSNSWHSGMPVIAGTKFAATKWIRERAFGSRTKL